MLTGDGAPRYRAADVAHVGPGDPYWAVVQRGVEESSRSVPLAVLKQEPGSRRVFIGWIVHEGIVARRATAQPAERLSPQRGPRRLRRPKALRALAPLAAPRQQGIDPAVKQNLTLDLLPRRRRELVVDVRQ